MSYRPSHSGFRFAATRSDFNFILVAATCLIASWSGRALADDAIVRPHRLHQHISGFGASSAWTAQTMDDATADLLFSVDSGVGLSLLRVRIVPDGTTWELATAQQAVARGASVWATPWSPAATFKSNDNVNFGGKLLPEDADAWAASLANFVVTMKNQGVNLLALSAQNEPTTGSSDGATCSSNPMDPDYARSCIGYEACTYTPTELGDFIASHLAPALSAAGANVQVMGPETQGWTDFSKYWSSFSAAAGNAVNVIATHEYNGTPAEYPDIEQSGRELWETEISDPTAFDPTSKKSLPDPGIGSGLRVAGMINAALTVGDVSAWHYWWINPGSDDNSGLFAFGTTPPAPVKRLYAMGNYSRFVRPGYFRIGADLSATSGVALSAFVDSATDGGSRKLVVVAINQTNQPITQKFRFDGYTTGSWQAWVTSDSLDLAPAPAIPDNGGGDFDYQLAAQSITTLQGVTTGKGPAIALNSSQDNLPPDEAGCQCRAAAGASSAPSAWPFALVSVLVAGRAIRRRTVG
ncbi:MAG TPA: hypothetical protein VGI10_07535 [Polyangiaceae bacterium]